MHVAIMGKDPDFQVMRAIDVLADLQHQRHRVGRPQIGRNDFGNLVADRLGNCAGVLFPLVVPAGRPRFAGPVFLLRHQEFRKFPECIRAVLLLVFLEFLRGFADILRAIQIIDVFFKFSAVN